MRAHLVVEKLGGGRNNEKGQDLALTEMRNDKAKSVSYFLEVSIIVTITYIIYSSPIASTIQREQE